MNLSIFGGSGFIGRKLSEHFIGQGDTVTVYTRNPRRMGKNLSGKFYHFRWDSPELSMMENTDVVINLSGASIAEKRWTQKRKDELWQSRMITTRKIVAWIEKLQSRPKLMINASAVGYYGNPVNEAVDESFPSGSGFLAELCQSWEKEAMQAERLGVRTVTLRLGVVLGNGGALKKMLPAFRWFAGAVIGSGRQGFPWIHIDDVAGAVGHIIRQEALDGPVNLVAPETVTMRDFTIQLGKTLRRPVWFQIPEQAMRLLFGEMASALVAGPMVLPKRLTESGYRFLFPHLNEALSDILNGRR